MKTVHPILRHAVRLLVLCFIIPLSAAVPSLLNYQGRVAVGTVNFDGSGQFKFALVNADGTSTYWSNDGTSAAGSEPAASVTRTVTKGLYSVQLGDTAQANMTSVPASVFDETDVRLRVWFSDGANGFQLLTPDQRLTAVGYAMKSASADTAATVADGAITAAKLAPGSVGSVQLAPGAAAPLLTITGTTQTAVANASYLATSAAPTAITLPATANVGDTVQVTGGGAGGWTAHYAYTDPTSWTARGANYTWWNAVASSADGSKLAAVVYFGRLYTSTDSGVTWTARESDRGWRSVASSADGSKLVAVVQGGQIYTSTDFGASWTARESSRGWFSVASSADGTKLVAAVQGGQIYTSADSGVSWTARESSRSWNSVASSADGSKLVAVPSGGQIYTSTDSGVSWTARESSRSWKAVASSEDGSKLVAGAYGDKIYTSTDSGVSWTAHESNRNWAALASSADGSRLAAVVYGGLMFTSSDYGANWTARESTRNWIAVTSSADGSKLAAAVFNGQIYTSGLTQVSSGGQNSNATFQYLGSGQWAVVGPANDLVSITGTTQTAVANASYLATSAAPTAITLPATANVGDTVQITGGGAGGWTAQYAYTDPTSWTARESSRDWYSMASSADGCKLAAIAVSGRIYISSDSGVTWTARESNRSWNSVASSADGSKLVAVVAGGQIYTSSDYGVSWTARESNRIWYSVASSADGSKLVAVDHGGQIYTSADSGVSWTARESNRYWLSVCSSADGSKLAAGVFNGQIYTSTDSGVTWTARESNRQWYSMASSSDGSKMAATAYGGQIYTSTDSGVTWTARDSNRNWISATSSTDGSRLTAVVFGGLIYTSTDSGVNWTARESTRNWRCVTSSSDGSKLAAADYGGQIYTSGPAQLASGGQNSNATLQYLGNGEWAAVQQNQIASDAVGNAQLRADSVDSSKIIDGSIVNADVAAAAAIADTKLATISSAGKVANTATTATPVSTADSIVMRDASGDFSAGTITATLNGNASNFTGPLAGEVTGTQNATSIAATTVTGKTLIGFSSTAGVISASDTILTAINKLSGNAGFRAPLSSPSFTGTVSIPADGLVVGVAQMVASGGNIGIGTATPTQAKLVINGGPSTSPGTGTYLQPGGGSFTASAHGPHTLSIYATGGIVSTDGLYAVSDARIKSIDGRSNGADDLNALMRIEVTDYHFRDRISKGDAAQKKVIAQQVEQVYPIAVSRMHDVVPDIYQKAICQDGWILLKTDLKAGERVRLTDDETTEVYEVLEVQPGKFRTHFKPKDDGVFVYGREVSDFRMVDYDAIAMLNVSATQELARRLAEAEKENAVLKQRLAAQTKSIEARLAALEQSTPPANPSLVKVASKK